MSYTVNNRKPKVAELFKTSDSASSSAPNFSTACSSSSSIASASNPDLEWI